MDTEDPTGGKPTKPPEPTCWEGNIKIKTTADCKTIPCEGITCAEYVNKFNEEQGDRENWDDSISCTVDYYKGGVTVFINFTLRQAVKIGCCSEPGCAIGVKVVRKKVSGCSVRDHDPVTYAILQDLLDDHGVGSKGKPKFPKCCVPVDHGTPGEN